ncbi:sulfite exporter TauE/SafE family protein [Pseudomonas jilinensis]|uniref:Probable membrane transporter protein n=1 Tax=Pseudomonas jilinensis TaxID=2078689 RepID=A0A396RWY6_9PSED|nr:sulfite exporter TauE/SafE family protein [Pseudomonas jilinensis]RHW21128.1 permease [Pseudomonas jilinensis]
MPELFDVLLPSTLPAATTLLLIALSAVTSAITASLGIGGGVLMLAVMALVMPPTAIIPVHGLVQFGSNLNRALMTLRHINLQVIVWFLPGVILGAWLASLILVDLPAALIQLCIAGFILLLVWGPAIPKVATGRFGTLVAATLTTFISLFVGATGPLVAAFVKQQQAGERFSTVATFAAAMSLQHAPKAVVYGAAGFVFFDWLGLILLMIAAGALGTWLGLHLLRHLNDRRFAWIFNGLLTLLAVRLLWQAWTGWPS